MTSRDPTQFLGLGIITPHVVDLEKTVYSTRNLDRSRTLILYPGTNWRFQITLENATREKVAELLAHRVLFFGQGSFDLPIPQILGVLTPSGAYRVRGAQAAGRTTLNVSGSDAELSIGAFFNIAGDSTLYQVVAMPVTTGSNKSFRVRPATKRAAANNAAISFTPTARVRYSPEGASAVTILGANRVRPTLDLEEVV